ncbi:NADH dehydrogenase [ubiquinone] 1 beta subcomplex subunit 9 [Aspergillus affinis]|uniref:NADH dehydrogenase [ubiquinone] 1 beta subcomplex subunit 9 n=1 Tax=Aspergillus affinis TaxID=1070780 RepID=UPI0022FF0F60|nr:LYR family protein [Aspergillus affinis]KAI9040517.1 LYR family protein [Aspergillus affinis]
MSTSAVTQLWRGQAVYIRSLFEANKDVRDPRQQKVLLRETEKLLENWKHPDPYRAPTAPGGMFSNFSKAMISDRALIIFPGNKYERNLPTRILPYASGSH